ncbi:hypothetical protein [Streptomyces sp. NBC_01190]|nr:hypothetical protein OG519_29675 [Streptomyces sp. NBC_01190]
MPHTTRVARVRHLRQPLQPAGRLPGPDVRLLTQPVKGVRDQG